MKLPNSNMDDMMDDLSMEKDSNHVSTDIVQPSEQEVQNTFLQLTPSTSTSQPPVTQRQRRSTVSVACERCRKRKTKCSGLPGPCTNCARLNVPCYEPGRRRTTVQSTLEDRMQRLRALTAANRFGPPERQMSIGEGQMPFNHPNVENRHSSVGVRQAAFNNPGVYELNAPSPTSAHSSEGWNAATNPASYFDSRLQETLDWTMSDFSDENMASASHRSEVDSGLSQLHHQRSGSNDLLRGSHDALQFGESFDIPATRDVAPSTAIKSESPVLARQTPIGFTISYDPAYFDDSELKPTNSNPASPLSSRPELKISEDIDFDDDSQPSKQVSPGPRESSKSSPTASAKASQPPADSAMDEGGYLGYQLTRSQTVPTSYPANIEHQQEQETGLVELIVRSSDTQRYIGVFFASVHKEFSFLNPTTFGDRRFMIDQLSNFNYNLIQQQNMMNFQSLLVAAIGVLVQHKSTNLSSQYVKQATSIQDHFEMWSSVGGIHCAILLALYCYLAQIMVYDTRQDESAEARHSTSGGRGGRYPVSNLWLHNCQIAAACIDLGMHQPLAMQEQIRSKTDIKSYLETCRSTIRSAYVLDRKISELRNRPRAFHDADFDQTLIIDLR